MDKNKIDFVLIEFPAKLKALNPETKGMWGKMNVHQMIEHMIDSIKEANGKIPRTLVTAPERLQAMQDFLRSEKEFKPNTKNVLMGEDPVPVRHVSVANAIAELEEELKDFEKHFKANPNSRITNAFFGDLNYDEWVQLMHKHSMHHLKQFGGDI